METHTIQCPLNHRVEYKCVPKTPIPEPKSVSKPKPVTKRKRCPNGTRKNPKTGECESKYKTTLKKPTKSMKKLSKQTAVTKTNTKTMMMPTKTKKRFSVVKPSTTKTSIKKSAVHMKSKAASKKLTDIIESNTP